MMLIISSFPPDSLLNMTHYQSSSKLLASISSYQYTRRTWRREVYDLLLSSELFKMDVQSLQYWKILTDNLVTHDKTMFKDLLGMIVLQIVLPHLPDNKQWHRKAIHPIQYS